MMGEAAIWGSWVAEAATIEHPVNGRYGNRKVRDRAPDVKQRNRNADTRDKMVTCYA